MPKETDLSLNEKTFILSALSQSIRLDGRSFNSFRDLTFTFGEEYGLVDVRLGKTRVIARVSAEVSKPRSDRPFEGQFMITTELGPMASPVFEAGRQTEQEVLLARLIEKSIRRSNALDVESLCIVSGQRCWSIRADVHYLSVDGNLVDASCLAVITALSHFRRPDITVSGDDITIHPITQRVPVPLSILHHPICVTFSFFTLPDEGGEGRTIYLVDATAQEESLREGDMTITLNKNGEVCQISKSGGGAIEATTLLQCAMVALEKVKELAGRMDLALREDERRRNVGNKGFMDVLKEGRAENDR